MAAAGSPCWLFPSLCDAVEDEGFEDNLDDEDFEAELDAELDADDELIDDEEE